MQAQTHPRSAGRTQEGTVWPPQFPIGLALIAVAWPTAWFGSPPYSEYTFFPLWFGYILTVDGVVRRRTGTSLLSRSPARFALLFGYSVAFWWVFEGINGVVGNWRYAMTSDYGPVAYAALASLAFSTVVPAVFETAEFYRSLPFFARPKRWWRIDPGPGGLLALMLLGGAMVLLTALYPRQAFPLVWLSVFFVVDPLNALTGGESIAARVARGSWTTVWVLFAAGITCGFFWEMWNYWSMPKWRYEIPYVGWFRVFEMPVLGYGGYLPFALELYAASRLLDRLVFRRRDGFLRFDREEGASPAR